MMHVFAIISGGDESVTTHAGNFENTLYPPIGGIKPSTRTRRKQRKESTIQTHKKTPRITTHLHIFQGSAGDRGDDARLGPIFRATQIHCPAHVSKELESNPSTDWWWPTVPQVHGKKIEEDNGSSRKRT